MAVARICEGSGAEWMLRDIAEAKGRGTGHRQEEQTTSSEKNGRTLKTEEEEHWSVVNTHERDRGKHRNPMPSTSARDSITCVFGMPLCH